MPGGSPTPVKDGCLWGKQCMWNRRSLYVNITSNKYSFDKKIIKCKIEFFNKTKIAGIALSGLTLFFLSIRLA